MVKGDRENSSPTAPSVNLWPSPCVHRPVGFHAASFASVRLVCLHSKAFTCASERSGHFGSSTPSTAAVLRTLQGARMCVCA